MGKNGLGKVFNIAGRSCLYFLSFGQSHIKHTKTFLIVLKFLQRKRKGPAQKTLSETSVANMNCVKVLCAAACPKNLDLNKNKFVNPKYFLSYKPGQALKTKQKQKCQHHSPPQPPTAKL